MHEELIRLEEDTVTVSISQRGRPRVVLIQFKNGKYNYTITAVLNVINVMAYIQV